MATKTIEQLEEEMNLERVRRNQRLITKLDKAQKRDRPKRRIFGKFLLVLLLVLAALLALAWMVLQRTNIYIGLGLLDFPFLGQIITN